MTGRQFFGWARQDVARGALDLAGAFAFTVIALFNFSAQAAPMHILVDAGHGGIDKGAVRGHLHESEIALKVANELAQLLRDDPQQRFKVSMTRTGDQKVSLKARTEMAKETKADLFVSIHLNSSTDARARGKEIYFQNQLPADEDALFLASRENSEEEEAREKESKNEPMNARTDLKRILEDMNRNHRISSSSRLSKTLLETWESKNPSLRFGSRAIRQAPFQVVSLISIPSVLVEIGFISHAQEGPLLAQANYQKQVAQSLYEGLVKYRQERNALAGL
jgi:N-acetylmuramoyl-L-alanine amidase